jgi:S-methylmethionine-dependent homocysteine/selenocysteine methylase
MTYVEEAIGIVAAAKEAAIPVVISFTVETDGLLPSGTTLADAIARVDAATDGGPAYYMVNCAHPSHFTHVLEGRGPWHRVRGIRANASRASHEELDNATELDRGDEADLTSGYLAVRDLLPQLAVVGGCCGTDLRHVDTISTALLPHPVLVERGHG